VLVSLAGIVPSLATPVVNVVIMAAVPHGRRAFALVAAGASPVVTLTLAGVLASQFGEVPGWRFLYIASGVVVGVLAALGHRMPEPTPSDAGAVDAETGPKPSVRPLIVMMIGVGLANAALGCAISFLVKGGPEAGISPLSAALVLGLSSAGSIVVRLVLAALSDRTGRDPLPAVIALMACAVAGFVALGFGIPVLYYVGIVLVMVFGWSWVGLLMYSILVRYRRDVPAAASIVQMVFFIGGVVGPVVMGLLVAAVDFDLAWWILAGAVLVALASAVLGFRVLPPFAHPPRAPIELAAEQ
jgi:MFS family permease